MLDESLIDALRSARHVAIFTGAGMSAESGIPTFRDRFDGLWAKYDPTEVATPEAFRRDPQFVWDWHVYLAESVRKAAPNPGHYAVAALQAHVPQVTVITQNIDNLHQVAGSATVLELHGNLMRLKAFVDDESALFQAESGPVICRLCNGYAASDELDPYAGPEDFAALTLSAGNVPHCPACGALLRPDVVWFGEPLEAGVLDDAFFVSDTCDVFFCIGTSLEVEPAASLPWRALNRGATVIEINPQPTYLASRAHAAFAAGSAVVLPEILARVWGERRTGMPR